MFFLVFVALAAAALLAGIAFGIAGRKAAYNYQVNESSIQRDKIIEVFYTATERMSLEELYRYVLYPSCVSNREYFIVDRNGKIVVPSNAYLTTDSDKQTALEYISENLEDENAWEGGFAFIDAQGFSNDIFLMTVPFTKGDSNYYIVQYTLVNEGSDLINDYINILFLSTLAAALAMLLPTVVFVELITEPLQEVNQVAKEYGRGNLQIRANESHVGEAGELAESFNNMADRLSQSINDLTNERNKLENIFNIISEGIIVFDITGEVTFSNDKMTDIFSKVPHKTTFDKKLQLVPFEEFWENLAISMDSGETSKKTEEGTNYAYEYTIVPRFDSSNQICIGATAFFRDITEAHKLDMTRRDYVANISHELRTPLQTLRGLIEPLADGMVKTEEDRMRYYDIILNETLRLSRLIDDMLELSKLQSRTIAFRMFPFNMNEILDSIETRFKSVMKEAGIYFSVHKNTGELPTVNGNPDRVNQILVILLDNAKKYTPSGGSITITSDYDEEIGKVFISVSDTGQGIHEYDIGHIFERFFKADRARGKKGTGLGLAIAKELLTYMGEDITVESEYGKGTKFTFTLKKAEVVNSWE
ncbi:MAG: cell wall metabolism sensor histidine kinase WalK [Saccharofermentans sp.]|nr:cell wall metabolism sensor histidine kinase WalK [Saccharofermentans sp.]